MDIIGKALKRSNTSSRERGALPTLRPEPNDRSSPNLQNIKLHDLAVTGPVAAFFRRWELPSSRDDVSQVMRFCIRHKKGDGAAVLVKALFERDGGGAVTLHFGCPFPVDEQGPLTDDDLKFLVRWIRERMPALPEVPVQLDLSGNHLTAEGLTQLTTGLQDTPQLQALDLSRNRFLTQPLTRQDTTRRTICRKLTSPRQPKEPLRAGDAIGELLACLQLRRLWLSGNPFAREDRERILCAVVLDSPALCALGMSDCALSEADIKILVQQDRRKGWRHLALGTKLTEGAMESITALLRTSETLETLDLGTTEPYSFLSVTELFHALDGNHSLKRLSVAGHSLRGNGPAVTQALRRNTCLRALDMSGSDISMKLLDALVRALSQQEGFSPNETLTTLILPEFGSGTVDHDKKELSKAKLSFAINRNRATQLPADTLGAFLACCAPAVAVPPELRSTIVDYIRASEREAITPACVVRKPDPTSAGRAAPRIWLEVRSPRT